MSLGHFIAIGVGLVAYVGALAVIWRRPESDVAAQRERDFADWRLRTGQPNATFAQFMGSEEAPRIYLSRRGKTAAVTALAALAVVAGAREWGYL